MPRGPGGTATRKPQTMSTRERGPSRRSRSFLIVSIALILLCWKFLLFYLSKLCFSLRTNTSISFCESSYVNNTVWVVWLINICNKNCKIVLFVPHKNSERLNIFFEWKFEQDRETFKKTKWSNLGTAPNIYFLKI